MIRKRVISGPAGDYMIRYTIGRLGWLPGDKPRRFSAYLHRFLKPDGDRELHNHPWRWAFSIVLWGGYTEERFCGATTLEPVFPWLHICPTCGCMSISGVPFKHITKRRLRPLSFNFIRGEDYHRVAELHGKQTWTLFIAGPKTKSWGFWDPKRGHVPWREFLAEKGLPVEY